MESIPTPAPNGRSEEYALQAQGDAMIASAIARVQAETQAAIMVAQRFKRSEAQARQELISAVNSSPRLAEKAVYHYPRGRKFDEQSKEWVENVIEGPSVYIAREAARTWGNISYGTEVVKDTDKERQIRSYAWDMQTNLRITAEATFRKVILRNEYSTKNGKREKIPKWIIPDERELRELSNKYASIGERNCLLKVVPSHLIDEVLEVAKTVTVEDAAKNPETARIRLADAFQNIGISVAMIEEDYLGHTLKTCTPQEIAKLRGVYSSIRDGSSTWEEYRKTILPSEEDVPELPALRELAKKLKWNDARLATEIGRNQNDISKLLAAMKEAIAKQGPAEASTSTKSPEQSSSQTQQAEQPVTAQSESQTQPIGEVISPTAAKREAPKSKLGRERDF